MKGRMLLSAMVMGLLVGIVAWASPSLNNLVIGATQEPSNLCPWEGSADTKENVMGIFFLGLTYYDSKGVLYPGLATEIPTAENGRLVVFYDSAGNLSRQEVLWTIRDDATWSDGKPITTDDVLFTYKVQQTQELPISTRAFSDLIKEIIKVNDKTFWIVYKVPNLFYAAVAGSIGLARFGDIAPKHIWEPIYDQVMAQVKATPDKAADIVEAQFLGAPPSTGTGAVVGSGAFKFEEWQINQFIRFSRRPGYFIAPPGPEAKYLKEITVRFIVNQATLISAILAGEIEAADDICLAGQDPAVLASQLGDRAVVETTPSGFIEKLNFNIFPQCATAADLLLGDKRTRQAILQAIDREDLATTVYPGAIVSNSFMIRGDVGFTDDVNQWPYDVEASKAQLAALGWKDSDGDGWLERVASDGRTVKFVMHWVATTAAFRVRTGEILQEFLKEVGIKLEVENLPGSVVFSTEYLNHGSECTWRGIVEYAEAGGIGQAPSDPLSNELYANDLLETPVDALLENVCLPDNGFGGTNITGWINNRFDELRAQALREFSEAKRVPILVEMQKIYSEELPTGPLYERSETVTKAKGLVNYTKGTAVARGQFWNAWEWGWAQNGAVAVR